MKFVPETLEESLNFERGMDPKTAIDIGVNRSLEIGDEVELLNFRTREPFDKGIIFKPLLRYSFTFSFILFMSSSCYGLNNYQRHELLSPYNYQKT